MSKSNPPNWRFKSSSFSRFHRSDETFLPEIAVQNFCKLWRILRKWNNESWQFNNWRNISGEIFNRGKIPCPSLGFSFLKFFLCAGGDFILHILFFMIGETFLMKYLIGVKFLVPHLLFLSKNSSFVLVEISFSISCFVTCVPATFRLWRAK